MFGSILSQQLQQWSGSLRIKAMLSFISWPQYFAAVVIIGLAYYGIVLVKYYREELLVFVHPKPAFPATTVPKFGGEVIGSIKPEPGESSLNAEDLQFPDGEPTAQDELINEMRGLINAFKGLDQKDEFLSLLSLIFSRYAGTEIDRFSLIEQVLENAHALSFTVDQAEIEAAWQKAA